MVEDPLNQNAATSQFKLDREDFVIGDAATFFDQAFSGNRVVVLASNDHRWDDGLFQMVADEEVAKALKNKKVKIALELPKSDQAKLAAFMKSKDPNDIGPEFDMIKPLLISAQKQGIEVHFVDLNEEEKVMSAKMDANAEVFKLKEKIAAATNEREAAAINQEFENQYAEDLQAFKQERLDISTNRMAANIGNLLKDKDTKVLHYTGRSHTNNEQATGVGNANVDLDEKLAKFGPTLLVYTFLNTKDVVVSAMKVDKKRPPDLFEPKERDLPDMVLGFPPREVQVFMQQEKLAGLEYERKVAVKDVLFEGLNLYKTISGDFLRPAPTDNAEMLKKKEAARDIFSKSYEKLVLGDMKGAREVMEQANKNKAFDGITGPRDTPLNKLMPAFLDLIDRIRDEVNKAAGKTVVLRDTGPVSVDTALAGLLPAPAENPAKQRNAGTAPSLSA